MARKRGEAAIMMEVETQEEWEDMISKEGLWVVDVYQEWAGPCNAMVANFRRIKNELGDELLHYAVAKADSIEFLNMYRGRCEPCFLYFAGGVLVGVVHGANAPLILRTLTEQLKAEHAVLDGKAERKKIKDPIIAMLEDQEKRKKQDDVEGDEEDDSDDSEKKQVTVAIIKPDAVKSDKVDEILEQIKAKGIEIVAHEERHLTEDEAREFYSHHKDMEYFEDLIQFMVSGPCHVMVLTKGATGDTVVSDWRDLIGPMDVDEAKEVQPESLRARFGTSSWMNGLHGSDSNETAAREMAFFFPDLAVPAVPGGQKKKKKKTKRAAAKKEREPAPKIQRTLALIRPDAFRTHKDEILEKINAAGFKVALSKEMTLTREQAEDFYKEHAEEEYFEELITRMTSGPLLALGLAREDAVAGWREALGPKEVDKAKEEAPDSLRAQFSVEETPINQLHGSDSPETAEKELDFFFPMQQTVAVIKPDAMGTKEEIIQKIHEAGFRIAARQETTITREIAEEFYADQKDKDYFEDLVEHMCSGPTMFMVLSKEDAVANWRDTIGPTDPEAAKEQAPTSLRAEFGADPLKNAVHGSSNPDHARKGIEQIFGPLEFDKDGRVKGEAPEEEEEPTAVEEEPAGEVQDVAPEYQEHVVKEDTARVSVSQVQGQSEVQGQLGVEGRREDKGQHEVRDRDENEDQDEVKGQYETQGSTVKEDDLEEEAARSAGIATEGDGKDDAQVDKVDDDGDEIEGCDDEGDDYGDEMFEEEEEEEEDEPEKPEGEGQAQPEPQEDKQGGEQEETTAEPEAAPGGRAEPQDPQGSDTRRARPTGEARQARRRKRRRKTSRRKASSRRRTNSKIRSNSRSRSSRRNSSRKSNRSSSRSSNSRRSRSRRSRSRSKEGNSRPRNKDKRNSRSRSKRARSRHRKSRKPSRHPRSPRVNPHRKFRPSPHRKRKTRPNLSRKRNPDLRRKTSLELPRRKRRPLRDRRERHRQRRNLRRRSDLVPAL